MCQRFGPLFTPRWSQRENGPSWAPQNRRDQQRSDPAAEDSQNGQEGCRALWSDAQTAGQSDPVGSQLLRAEDPRGQVAVQHFHWDWQLSEEDKGAVHRRKVLSGSLWQAEGDCGEKLGGSGGRGRNDCRADFVFD